MDTDNGGVGGTPRLGVGGRLGENNGEKGDIYNTFNNNFLKMGSAL